MIEFGSDTIYLKIASYPTGQGFSPTSSLPANPHFRRANLSVGVGRGVSLDGGHQVVGGEAASLPKERVFWVHSWGWVWPDVLRPVPPTDCEAAGSSRSPFLPHCSFRTLY